MPNNFQVGELIVGEVTNVKPYALFLKFEDGSNGLLHISEISDNYIRDIERFGVVGDKIKVVVLSVDPKNGFLRVSYKQVPKEESFTTHSNTERSVHQLKEGYFETLKKKLPSWIDEAYEKAVKND